MQIMSKIRINDLARELEIKSGAILEALPLVGVTEKKAHSSSLDDWEAEKIRAYFHMRPGKLSAASQTRSQADTISTTTARPFDALKAIMGGQPVPVQPLKSGQHLSLRWSRLFGQFLFFLKWKFLFLV